MRPDYQILTFWWRKAGKETEILWQVYAKSHIGVGVQPGYGSLLVFRKSDKAQPSPFREKTENTLKLKKINRNKCKKC